jgi:transcriptional regulator
VTSPNCSTPAIPGRSPNETGGARHAGLLLHRRVAGFAVALLKPLYRNPYFEITDLGRLHGLIEQTKFGLLVSGKDGLRAAHIPFVLHRDDGPNGTLVAHTPRADPISRSLDGETELLVIFEGPRAYVSPSWYESRINFPTYNFLVVHAYGPAKPLTDEHEVIAHLHELIGVHERERAEPWRPGKELRPYLHELLPGIAPFSLEIERLQGKFRLSQHKSAADRAGVRRGLRERGRDDDVAIAELMDDFPYETDEGRFVLAPVLVDGVVRIQDD